jgi:hypothetical protein
MLADGFILLLGFSRAGCTAAAHHRAGTGGKS